MSSAPERIDLDAPLARDFQPVVRLIIGGIAERVDFAFEEIDDLQLAVERLLAEAGSTGTVHLAFEVGDEAIRTRVGPLDEGALTEALRDGDGESPSPGSRCGACSRRWWTRSGWRTRATTASSSGSTSGSAGRELDPPTASIRRPRPPRGPRVAAPLPRRRATRPRGRS